MVSAADKRTCFPPSRSRVDEHLLDACVMTGGEYGLGERPDEGAELGMNAGHGDR